MGKEYMKIWPGGEQKEKIKIYSQACFDIKNKIIKESNEIFSSSQIYFN